MGCMRVSGSTERLGEVSRGCGCELLFGDENGRPCVSDGEWRVVCVFHEVADELLGVVSRAAVGLQDLGHVTWAVTGRWNEGWAAGERRDIGDIKVRGGTILIKDKIHARVFDLAIHHTSEGWTVRCTTLVPLCECVTSARHLPTAACLRSTPPPYRQVQGSAAVRCGNMSLLATDTKTTVLSLVRFTVGLHEVTSGVGR